MRSRPGTIPQSARPVASRFLGRLAKCVLVLVAVWCGAAAAQFPARPVRLVVPFPAGGSADTGARILAAPLSQALGQTVVVDNRPGGDGAVAGELVAKAPPDGYTLMLGTSTGMSFLPVVRRAPPYDPQQAFTPVGLAVRFVSFLFASPELPVRTVAELIDHARAHPGQLNYGTGNATSIMLTAQLLRSTGLDLVHIPYKGDAPLVTDLVAGRVQLAFIVGGAAALGHAREGRLKVLATAVSERSPMAPEVPTLAEAGVSAVSTTSWGGVFGPARLPREVVDRLARELQSVLARTEVRDQLARQLLLASPSTPEALRDFLRQDLLDTRRLVAEAGIQPE